MSDLVGNPEDRFSGVAAHLSFFFTFVKGYSRKNYMWGGGGGAELNFFLGGPPI